jgi:hypothetical protein
VILYHRGLKQPHYTARPGSTGWVIFEGDQPIAYTDSEAYARAIAQALNLQRILASCNVTVGRPPARPELN